MSHYLRTLCIPTLTYLLDVSRLKTEKQLLLLPPYLVTKLHTYLAKKGSRKNQGKQLNNPIIFSYGLLKL